MKFLICFTGETFRYGGQFTRNRGCIQSQEKAVKTHLEFINFIENKMNLKCEILFNIYKFKKEYDDEYIKKYNNYKCYINFNNNLLGEQKLLDNTINLINNFDYEFILFLRPDHFLKNFFQDVFLKDLNKVKYLHINEISKYDNTFNIGLEKGYCGIVKNNVLQNPKVNHQICYIPKIFFKLLKDKHVIKLHDSYINLKKYTSEKNIGLFLYTFHSSSTNLCWNPLFYQTSRENTTFWPFKELTICPLTFKIKKCSIDYNTK